MCLISDMKCYCGHTEKLIESRQTEEESPSCVHRGYVQYNHKNTYGHSGLDCAMNICSSKYANITRDAVEHSKSFCVVL